MNVEKDEQTKEYFKEEVYKKVIQQYLFLQSLKYKLGDDYIKTKYRINPSKIIALYNAIPKEQREKLEQEIETKIENKEIDLNALAVQWHKENFNIANQENNEGEER